MNLFDILSNDERVIVLSNKDDAVIYTWNHSLTLQCWKREGSVYFHPAISRHYDNWEEIDVRTLSEPPFNYQHARSAAILWDQGEGWKEGEDGTIVSIGPSKANNENAPKLRGSRRKKKAR